MIFHRLSPTFSGEACPSYRIMKACTHCPMFLLLLDTEVGKKRRGTRNEKAMTRKANWLATHWIWIMCLTPLLLLLEIMHVYGIPWFLSLFLSYYWWRWRLSNKNKNPWKWGASLRWGRNKGWKWMLYGLDKGDDWAKKGSCWDDVTAQDHTHKSTPTHTDPNTRKFHSTN